jgi:hypothetical protein
MQVRAENAWQDTCKHLRLCRKVRPKEALARAGCLAFLLDAGLLAF